MFSTPATEDGTDNIIIAEHETKESLAWAAKELDESHEPGYSKNHQAEMLALAQIYTTHLVSELTLDVMQEMKEQIADEFIGLARMLHPEKYTSRSGRINIII